MEMDLGIAGRRAAVAAASQGLGFATAEALARAGVAVAICGRRQEAIDEAVANIGRGTVGLVADVSTPDGATAFVRAARDALGGVDILVPNAGGPPPGDFAHTTVDQYLDAFELNCRSSIAMCYEAVPEMRANGWGRVVAITSVAVRQPIAGLILSNTARAGLTGFLKTLAREVAPDGVTVNSLLPGMHRTERLTKLYDRAGLDDLAQSIPARTLGDAADFGQVAAFLCSEPARFVTGAAIQVDGGAYTGLL
jgi:3-oxoacyl-[acyl-carrier protein] reductase